MHIQLECSTLHRTFSMLKRTASLCLGLFSLSLSPSRWQNLLYHNVWFPEMINHLEDLGWPTPNTGPIVLKIERKQIFSFTFVWVGSYHSDLLRGDGRAHRSPFLNVAILFAKAKLYAHLSSAVWQLPNTNWEMKTMVWKISDKRKGRECLPAHRGH